MDNMRQLAELAQKPSDQFDLPDWKLLVGELSSRNDALRQEVQRLKVLCDHDAALNILNRRGLHRALLAEIARTNRHNVISSFIYIDIDKFKGINDRYGHAQGDHVLKCLADHIKSRLRKLDSFARLGGDEFGIVLSHATIAQATSKAGLLATSLAQASKKWGLGAQSLSFSAGVSEIRGHDEPDEIIKRADEYMYVNKQIGGEKQNNAVLQVI